ncbi:hypothetical protein OPQ81_008419 [Rhizoctonia solani]|nr:hypothetical protein OPQ81_008419 [Rhizoctonia solani]
MTRHRSLFDTNDRSKAAFARHTRSTDSTLLASGLRSEHSSPSVLASSWRRRLFVEVAYEKVVGSPVDSKRELSRFQLQLFPGPSCRRCIFPAAYVTSFMQ